MTLLDPEEVVRVEGPWTHRDVPANGSRFHVAEMGEGPLVLLLHGFPTFWWTWRHALPVLAEAGYHAAAMDLRGYAGSDHPPRGYDPFTLSADVSGVIRSLGSRDAVVVGHGWGGFLAWTAAVTHPEAIRAIVPVSMPHPRRLRASLLGDAGQRSASAYAFGFQVPASPERDLLENGASEVGRPPACMVGHPVLARRPHGGDLPGGHAAAQHRALRAGVPPVGAALGAATRRHPVRQADEGTHHGAGPAHPGSGGPDRAAQQRARIRGLRHGALQVRRDRRRSGTSRTRSAPRSSTPTLLDWLATRS